MNTNSNQTQPTPRQIVAKLKRKPGKTAQELGTTVVFMRKLENEDLVTEIGRRETGQRGRPPVEWAAVV